MSRFSLRLHYATGRKPDDEPLDALDEVEARELARMRLLLTRDYSEIELRREALRPLDRAGRRALVAACSPEVWPPD